MAKITIIEQDNSNASSNAATENIVYVPGYAVKGPVNSPVLCTTYASFISQFGSTPYIFKADQIYDSSKVASMGDYEKSYLYAAELLKQGLPVLYERVASKDNTNKASLQINFKNIIIQGIHISGEDYYRIVGQKSEIGTTIIWELTKGTAEDIGELVDSSLYTCSISEDLQTITFTYNDSENEIEIGPIEIVSELTISESNTDNYFSITAKYVGEYGRNISISLSEASISSTADKYYVLTIAGARYIVSFNSSNDYYIQSVLADVSDVDIELQLSQDFIATNLYALDTLTNEPLEYTSTGDEVTISEIYDILKGSSSVESCFEKLKDVRSYDVKFITSGAYYNLSASESVVATNMLDTAVARTDALALIDMKRNTAKDSYLTIVKSKLTSNYVNGEDRNNYGSLIAPSTKVLLSTTKTNEWMPGSFNYLKCLASSINVNPIWFAVAGVNRALISDISEVEFEVSGSLLDTWQSDIDQNINPIMNIRPYGYCIYGNRTLKKNINGLTSSSFTNIRVLINEVKKLVIQTASSLTYESNDIILFNNFKSAIQPTLNKMVSNRGLLEYKILKVESNKKGTFKGIVRLTPIEAVENFDITFTLEDNTASVE